MTARRRWNVAAAMAMAMTVACGTTSEEGSTETAAVEALQGVARYEIADQRLTLHATDGSTLVFERAEKIP